MGSFAELWLVGLYVLSLGVAFGAFLWFERTHGDRPWLPAVQPHSQAEETALEALSAMRGLIHQLGNNAHELALQFDLVVNSPELAQQPQMRERLRLSLHRFTTITHQVAQMDARLTGYVAPGAKTSEPPPHH